jgi:hypothetical protein
MDVPYLLFIPRGFLVVSWLAWTAAMMAFVTSSLRARG